MNEKYSIDLIKAIVFLADQVQLMANSLERIEAQLSSISIHVEHAGVNISDAIINND